jgi:hypothetical protein
MEQVKHFWNSELGHRFSYLGAHAFLALSTLSKFAWETSTVSPQFRQRQALGCANARIMNRAYRRPPASSMPVAAPYSPIPTAPKAPKVPSSAQRGLDASASPRDPFPANESCYGCRVQCAKRSICGGAGGA